MNCTERIHQHPWPLKLVTWLVLGTQCLFPFQGQLLAASTVSVMPAASSFPAPVLTPKNVVVNRTVPKVQPPSTELRFSAVPTDGEIFAAHIFKEPIIPVGKIASPAENKDLTQALMDFRNRQDSDDAGAIENFLQAYPDSKWRISLLANLGSHYRHTMQFTKALAAWREMWALGRNVTDPDVKSVVDGAAAEMAQLLVTLGWSDELQALLKELNGRQLHGAAYVWIDDARLALIQMQKRPDRTFRCGPVALSHVSASLGLKNPANIQSIRAEMASTNGTSLAQNWLLSKRLGLNYQMAMRKRGAAIPLPCVVHWKQGHFSALTKMDNGRYLVEEGGFSQGWVSAQVLDEEASGYFLIPAGPLPAGWDAVTEQEGQNAWGRSAPERKNPKLPCCPPKGGGGGGEPCRNCGMAQYMVYTMMVALYVGDVPVGYTPPIGPAVEFRVNYNELDSSQPAVFPYSNLGRQWDYNWLAFVSDDTTQPDADVEIIFGESDETYTGFNTGSQTYAVQQYDQTRLIKTSDTSYERRYPDGSMEIYSFPDSTNGPRRVFLTRKLDPAGNALTFTYDSSNRLVSVQDAIGQVTTLSYELAGDPLKITKVTDPFGRYATFQYNSTNNTAQLTNITDVIGISSSFTYGSPSGETDFINSMTTPYGTTTFTNNGASSTNISGAGRQIDITDPLGAKERFEFSTPNAGQIQDIPDNLIPAGVNSRHLNSYIDSRTTFYWDRKAMQDYPGDYSKAKKYVWLMEQNDDEVVSSTLECVINPLESPVFYAYPGQSYYAYYAGTLATPTAIARVLDDGTTQLQQYQYNSIGRPTNSVDPIGRTTLYTYATNNFDLLAVSRLAASQTNMLARLTYNSQHRPLTYVDASGQTTYLGYNTNGQLTALTNALAQVITLAYDTNNYLTNISGALPYAPISAAYDGFGRVRTVTDSEGYSVTYDYDAADRPTKVTYPDGTYEQITYKNLDPVLGRDRMGRWTAATYNAQRQLTAIEDALGRLTSFERCGCGALDSFTDPLGRTTTFVRDVQKRVTTKIYPDGTQLNYTYETNTSRLKSVTDAKNQTTAYSYYNDNNLKQVTYSNAVIATPSVSLTYDTNYNRLLTMTDGIGTTTYGYNPITTTPTLGAGRLASVDGPLANDTVTYSYDALGRRTSQTINGMAESVNYDALGRVTLVTNALGSFTNVYVRATGMIATNLYPNGQQAVFSYYGTTNDERLQQIQNLTPGGQNLSTFGYVYDANGEITNWTEQADNNTPTVQVEEYDPVNQLISSTVHSGSIGGSVLKQFIYNYDAAGNRTSEQIQSSAGASPAISSSSYNNVNQLASLTGNSGPMRFRGTLDSTGTVTVAGSPATMISHTNFTGYANVSQGTNVVSVVATDYSSHSRTNNYQIIVTNNGVAETLTYDLNGNLSSVVTATSTNAYQWDAANRMVQITQLSTNNPQLISKFTYDGLGRRVQDIELQNGVSVSTNKFVWCGVELCEQRNSTGTIVTRRFFGEGEQISGTNYFFTRDHLGSVREMTDNTGAIRARYDYDPYGRRTKLQGDLDADFGYAGMYYHAASGLNLTYFRPYDADLGRWLSRDPLGEIIGLNLYDYVLNNPINWFDPYGACPNSSSSQQVAKDGSGGGGGGGGGGGQDASQILADTSAAATVDPYHGLLNIFNNSLTPPPEGNDYKGLGQTFMVNGNTMKDDAFSNYTAGYASQSYANKYFGAEFALGLAIAAGVGFHLINNEVNAFNTVFNTNYTVDPSEIGDWFDKSGIPDILKGALDAITCP